MNLYKENNTYYIYKDNVYYIADIVIKGGRTISVTPSAEYVEYLENPIEMTYYDVKREFIK